MIVYTNTGCISYTTIQKIKINSLLGDISKIMSKQLDEIAGPSSRHSARASSTVSFEEM